MSGGWRPVIDLKQLNAHIYTPRFHMHTISSVLNTIERGDYAFKIDLQDAYFHVLIQHEVPELCLRKQGISVPSTSLPSEHCPEGTYSSGAQSGSLPPSSGDIGNSICR